MTSEVIQAPVFADFTHAAREDAFFLRIHDRPLRERFDHHEEHAQ